MAGECRTLYISGETGSSLPAGLLAIDLLASIQKMPQNPAQLPQRYYVILLVYLFISLSEDMLEMVGLCNEGLHTLRAKVCQILCLSEVWVRCGGYLRLGRQLAVER
jgi:hypothetical protein